jgi:hypothetical protein
MKEARGAIAWVMVALEGLAECVSEGPRADQRGGLDVDAVVVGFPQSSRVASAEVGEVLLVGTVWLPGGQRRRPTGCLQCLGRNLVLILSPSGMESSAPAVERGRPCCCSLPKWAL